MTSAAFESAGSLPLKLKLEVDRLCDEFEWAWKAGQQPQIEDFLNRIQEPAREALLRELIVTELEVRRRHGAPASLEEYRLRFPENQQIAEEVFGIHDATLVYNPTTTVSQFEADVDSVADASSLSSQGGENTQIPQQVGRFLVRSRLGQGAFGDVYLAHDPDLDRLVALKVPRAEQFSSQTAIDSFLHEARIAVRLDHPGIVKAYDVSRNPGMLIIVLEYVEGITLADAIATEQFTAEKTANLMAKISDAVNYANEAGLVHRDLKPANILIDKTGRPRVTDFGLALHEDSQVSHKREVAGTPAYMAPEQVRGEAHRLDGRTDQWSLGVMLYELLTGRRPFSGTTKPELFEEIKCRNPKPPRQINPSIPTELERICLKCLCQRMPDRYTTVGDMANDLRYWLEDRTSPAKRASTGLRTAHEQVETTPQVLPKGLRSFDGHDAEFFLELLPGPRDREGLPDSLRFWKHRIEERDADKTFSIGLIYGPSGCGKSSLVKAGLLPLLGDNICPVYVEATHDDTEIRLLKSLRKHCPQLPLDMSLSDVFAALREGHGPAPGKKLLIVLDQFEQWLHAEHGESKSQLIDALRHCDGGRLQCIVMVRVDFWLAVSRFMKDVEIRIVENKNSTLVDLFDVDHARRILAAFGRAFGRLPEDAGKYTEDQLSFLNQAIEDLAEQGKVTCVRLALFAEMMKGKAWTPSTLIKMGGMRGVGGVFLEETFSGPTAPPEHRKHQKAARAVLKTLLPECGSEIKGNRRPSDELLVASGYVGRPSEFDKLINILDGELRLITPTDPEGVEAGNNELDASASLSAAVPATADAEERPRYFQLTHDYLVPSLRDWLTLKQRETLLGRAELKLAERSALWNSHRERKQLPTFREWFVIRLLTNKQQWAESERTMMAEAGWQRLVPVLFLLAIAAFMGAGWWGYEQFGEWRAEQLANQLRTCETKEIPSILLDVGKYRRWVNDPLYDGLSAAVGNRNPRQELHFRIALARVDRSQVTPLLGLLLKTEPADLPFICNQLVFLREELRKPLRALVKNPDRQYLTHTLRAAAALTILDRLDSDYWDDASGTVVEALVQLYHKEPQAAVEWAGLLKPIAEKLQPSLRSMVDSDNAQEKDASTEILDALFSE